MNREEINKQLQRLQDKPTREHARNMLGIAGLIKLGGSYVLVLPRDWIDWNCAEVKVDSENTTPFVQFSQGEGDSIVITPLTEEALAELLIHLERKEKADAQSEPEVS